MQTPRARSPAYQSNRRWTPEEAGEAIAALKRSGLELTAFALREGLDPQRLSRWRRRLAASPPPVFEEVVAGEVIAASAASSEEREPFEIVLASGRVVRVPESFSTDALRRLLAVVDEVHPC